jgi:hypothetical protein
METGTVLEMETETETGTALPSVRGEAAVWKRPRAGTDPRGSAARVVPRPSSTLPTRPTATFNGIRAPAIAPVAIRITFSVKHHALAFVVAGVDFMGYIPVPHPWRGGQIIKIGVFVALQIDIKLDDAGGGGIQCPAALAGG